MVVADLHARYLHVCIKTVHFPHKTPHTWGYRFGATPLVPDLQLS